MKKQKIILLFLMTITIINIYLTAYISRQERAITDIELCIKMNGYAVLSPNGYLLDCKKIQVR